MFYPKPKKKTEAEKRQEKYDKFKKTRKKITFQATVKRKKIKKRTISTSRIIKQCDTVFSLLVRKRDVCCQRCGSEISLQNSHTITRSNYFLRWDEQNCIALCVKCHLYWWHRDTLEAAQWFMQKFPERYEYLMANKHRIIKRSRQDYLDLLDSLKKRLKELDQT